MKTFLISWILFSFFGIAHANSNKLSTIRETFHKNEISTACEKNYQEAAGNKGQVCACVARNFIPVSRKWSAPAQKEGILAYTTKYFAGTLIQNESAADPYLLDEFLADLLSDCLENSKFNLNKA